MQHETIYTHVIAHENLELDVRVEFEWFEGERNYPHSPDIPAGAEDWRLTVVAVRLIGDDRPEYGSASLKDGRLSLPAAAAITRLFNDAYIHDNDVSQAIERACAKSIADDEASARGD